MHYHNRQLTSTLHTN